MFRKHERMEGQKGSHEYFWDSCTNEVHKMRTYDKKYSYITIKNKTIELELLFEIFSVIAGIYELRVILL